MKNLMKKQKGFTIIEVLIVLAIAGLILLIVFLAVPALQRNARNTSRRNDVAALLGAVSEYANNNNGLIPTACSGTATILLGAAPAVTAEAKVGYYNQAACAAGTSGLPTNGGTRLRTDQTALGDTVLTAPTLADGAIIQKGMSCTATGGTALGGARAVAAVYVVETGANTYDQQCQEG